MWSIGIYTGSSPFQLRAPANHANPILRHANVTDATADFVADHFMLRKDGRWYMFFEMLDRVTNRGEISLATSDDGFVWRKPELGIIDWHGAKTNAVKFFNVIR